MASLNWRESRSWTHARLLAWSVVLCLLTSASSPADTPSLADVSLEELAQLPVESVTGASKFEQSIRQAPASITVYTAEEFTNYGWRTLADALRAAPGFHIRNDRFYDYIGNRGFTRPFDYNSRTLVLVNGHRINDPIYQQGSVGTDFILDSDLIEKVEIIRGPGSSVYGSSAFYGAVNVIPKRGSDFAGGQVSVLVDDTLGVKGRVTVGNRSPSGLEYVLSASGTEYQGEKQFPLSDHWRTDTGLSSLTAHKRDGTQARNAYFNLRWSSIEVEAAYVRRVKDVLPEVYMTDDTQPSTGIDERSYVLGRYTATPLENGKLVASLSYDHYQYDGRFAPSFTSLREQNPYARSDFITTEVHWQQDLGHGNTLLFGGELQNNLVEKIGRIDTVLKKDVTRIRKKTSFGSAFAQADWRLLSTLSASTGARLDSYSDQPNRTSPRLGLIWDPAKNTNVKVLYGESFRVPNIEERYTSEAGNIQNPDLHAEANQGWEMAITQKLDDTWSLEGNAYRTEAKGLIQAFLVKDPVTHDDVYQNTNSQSIITEGIEVAANAFFKSNVQARISATLQDTHDGVTGSTPYDAPSTLIKANLSTPVVVKWLRLSGELLYVSSRLDSNNVRLSGYTVANVSLRAARLWHRWDASLTVNNIANARWSEPTNWHNILNEPRSVFLRLSYDF